MKVSLNLAQFYSNVDLVGIDRSELVQRLGAQLGAIENVTDWAPKYRGVVVVKVISCEKHPNADKLKVCKIDDNGVVQDVERDNEGYVQVVCGAPNVEEGMLAAWIPPGSVVPSTFDGEKFKLEARELRGEVSNGMLASPHELDISNDHDGILEIVELEAGYTVKVGANISNYYGLDDYIVDCENKMFTHRPDCFGNLGVAREIAGMFGLKFQSPEWYLSPILPDYKSSDDSLELNVKNEIKELVPRFTIVSMSGVSVKPSPVWMQGFLKRVGIKPINNIVDVTNYVMHVTGQPLHAFDYDKIVKVSDTPGIHPRLAKKGEKIKLLGDKTIELGEDDIVIATDKHPVALAGVMGGAETEVDDNTQSIIIECANFDMYAVRRTSMRHGLFTDAVTRFNKGQSPLQNDRVLRYAMKLMYELADAKQASEVYDLTNFDLAHDNLNHIEVTADFINSRLGSNLTVNEIKSILENVEFVVSIQGDTLQITAPFWRMDIGIKEDIVEEVGRLYGYDKLPVVLPSRSIKPSKVNEQRQFKQTVRDKMVKAGANEVLTYSFVHGELMKNTGTDPEDTAYHIRNALSPDLQFYRTSLIPSLLSKVHGNIKAQMGSNNNEFAIFEIGKVHIKGIMEDDEPELPKQMNRLSFVITADSKTAKQHSGSAYYVAKKYMDEITNGQLMYQELSTNEHPITSPYHLGRSAEVTIKGNSVGVIGEISPVVKKKLKLPEYTAGFELDLDILRENIKPNSYEKLSLFPVSSQDITFEVANSYTWRELATLIDSELAVASAEDNYHYSLEPLDIYSEANSKKIRYSYKITLSHNNKTLKTEEVSKILEHLAKVTHAKYKAVRI